MVEIETNIVASTDTSKQRAHQQGRAAPKHPQVESGDGQDLQQSLHQRERSSQPGSPPWCIAT